MSLDQSCPDLVLSKQSLCLLCLDSCTSDKAFLVVAAVSSHGLISPLEALHSVIYDVKLLTEAKSSLVVHWKVWPTCRSLLSDVHSWHVTEERTALLHHIVGHVCLDARM